MMAVRCRSRASERYSSTGFVGLVLALIVLAVTGCVESRARQTPVPPAAAATATAVPVVPTATPTAVPVPTATSTPVPTATPVPTVTPVPPTPTLTPTSTPAPEPTITPAPGSGTFNLSLDFVGIGDESVVRSDTVLLRGLTSADAIVSVNGVIVEVQADGTFELTLVLESGPNVVDVVASDLSGNSINSSLAIISIPPEESP